jgi:hypothetical protein
MVRRSEVTQADFRRFLVRPPLLRNLVTRQEFEMCRKLCDLNIVFLQETLGRHEVRISSLEGHIVEEKRASLRAISDRNVEELRKLFGLSKLTSVPEENVINEIRGMLEEYSDKESDSVDLVHSVRGEEE